MPALAAALLYEALLAVVTAVVVSTAMNLAESGIERVIQFLKDTYGLSDDDASILVANKILDFMVIAGGIFIALRTKMGLKVADRLGLTRRGWKPGTISETGKAKLAGKVAASAPTTAATAAEVAEIAAAVAKKKGITLAKVNEVASLVAKVVGLPVGVFYAFAQYLDYAAWQNPYQKTMESLLAKIGIHPDTPLPSSRVVSAETWKRVRATIEVYKPVSITMPDTRESRPYSQENLAAVVDQVAAMITKSGKDATYKNVMGIVLPLIHITESTADAESGTAANQNTGNTQLVPAATAPVARTQQGAVAAGTTTTRGVQVFTGVISQGSLGAATSFTPRTDDLISSLGELETAAANNLAPFIASLPGRIRYEIKTVTNVTSADGFTQRGTTQRIVVGAYANGQPKYKTVTNRFAVMTLFITNKGGGKTQLAQITLGPTDAVSFQPSAADISAVESYLQATVHTTNLQGASNVIPKNSSAAIESGTTTQISQETTAQNRLRAMGGVVLDGVFVDAERHYDVLYKIVGNELWVYQTYDDLFSSEEKQAMASDGGKFARIPERLALYGVNAAMISSVPFIADVVTKYQSTRKMVARFEEFFSASPVAPASATAAASATGSASTLYEYYAAKGLPLPSVAERAQVYASLGLGVASYYTGTAEQNVKLLAALKK